MTYLFLWKIERRNLSRALFHMAIDRISLTRDPRVAFFKSLGTGTGTTFTPTDADISTWGLLVTLNGSEDSTDSISAMRAISAWRSFAVNEELFHLDPIASHGLWAKRDPFLPSDSMDCKALSPIGARKRTFGPSLIKAPPINERLK